MCKYHIFRAYNRRGRIELNSTLNIDYDSALSIYCDYIIDYILGHTDCYLVSEKEIREAMGNIFSDYESEDPIILDIYQSYNGELNPYMFPIDDIVKYVNAEINKYGSNTSM